MKNRKTTLLLAIILILTAASLYLVYIIQDGSSPLAIFNTRASEEDTTLDEELNNLLAQVDNSPTPTVPYKSTSPSPTVTNGPGGPTSPSTTLSPIPSVSITAAVSPTAKVSVTVPASPTPSGNIIYVTATPMPIDSYISPTPITTLPVAGIADHLPAFILSGGLLVAIALFL